MAAPTARPRRRSWFIAGAAVAVTALVGTPYFIWLLLRTPRTAR